MTDREVEMVKLNIAAKYLIKELIRTHNNSTIMYSLIYQKKLLKAWINGAVTFINEDRPKQDFKLSKAISLLDTQGFLSEF